MAALDADEKERFGSLIFCQSGIYLPLMKIAPGSVKVIGNIRPMRCFCGV